MKWLKRKPQKRKLVILVDYENVSMQLSVDSKVVNWNALVRQCLEIGNIEFAFVFVPHHLVSYQLPLYIHDKGFYVMSCPGKSGKEKDRVDTIMTEMGMKLINNSSLTDVVIVSHDGDFVRLANYARFHGKKVTVFAGDKISFLLGQTVDVVLPLPAEYK